MKVFGTVVLLFFASLIFAQHTDTLRFYSEAFQSDREVYIQTPEFYRYQSEEVRLPVVYVLDAQHEWFYQPMKNDLRFLQYTHEIPQMIIVGIPHVDRVEECAIQNFTGTPLPLHQFITSDLERELETYRPNAYRVLIGHSFSASFSLYSYLQSPEFYSAVLANSPLDQIGALAERYNRFNSEELSKVYWSVGGSQPSKDSYHRKVFDQVRIDQSEVMNKMNILTCNSSTHNSVPLVAVPEFLSELFTPFCSRYQTIAEVDLNYQLESPPGSVEEELAAIRRSSLLGIYFYPPELPDVNGIASRYLASGYNDHAKAVYHWGVELYPESYDFHLQLADLTFEEDPVQCKKHLDKVLQLLATVDSEDEDRAEIEAEIKEFYKENGWE